MKTFYKPLLDIGYLFLFVTLPLYNYAITCSETSSSSGRDDDPTTVLINSFPCLGGATATAATIDASIGSYCPSWYEYDIYINGALAFSNQCNLTGFDISAYLPITSVELRSRDNDAYSDGITLSLTINFTYVNNEPCNSSPLSVGCAVDYITNNTTGATDSGEGNPGCGNYNGGDVWYSITVPSSGSVTIETKSGGINDGALALYSDGGMGCSSLTLVSCDENSGTGNMPSLTASGLTPGDTYYVRFWEEGNNVSGTFDISAYDPNQTYCLYGDAVLYTPSGHTAADNCAQMTAEANDQNGCIWATNQIDFSSDFDYSLSMYFGDNGNGADGCTFTFQNEGPDVCGQTGGQLGAGGITDALVIEFDTYDNDNPTHNYDMLEDHIAVNINGDLQNSSGPLCGPIEAKSSGGNIDDGNEYTIRVVWDASSNTLDIYFDGVLRLSCSHDFVTNVFGGDPTVYWGFTGATGGLNNQQWFCPGTLPVLAVDIAYFNVECDGENNKISWSSSEEKEAKYIIERSLNGYLYEAIKTVESAENKHFIIYDEDAPNNAMYRIKQYKEDGKPVYSQVQSSQCGDLRKLDFYPVVKDNTLELTINNLNENGIIEIRDLRGSHIKSVAIDQNTTMTSIPFMNRSDIYFITLKTNTGNFKSKKVIKY